MSARLCSTASWMRFASWRASWRVKGGIFARSWGFVVVGVKVVGGCGQTMQGFCPSRQIVVGVLARDQLVLARDLLAWVK